MSEVVQLPVSRRSAVWAVLAALVCWAGVTAAAVAATVVMVAANAETVLAGPVWMVDAAAGVWFGAAMVVATRLAAGALRRRRVRQVVWLVVLPAGWALLGLNSLLSEPAGMPVWQWLLESGLGVGGSAAAVTLWPPAPVRP